MLTELCEYLKNWDFNRKAEKHFGTFVIKDGKLAGIEEMAQDGQYFRIVGSLFNDGVYQYIADQTERSEENPEEEEPAEGEESPSDESTVKPEMLVGEVFEGAVWLMAVPKEVLTLAEDIAAWQEKYGGVDSVAMSPYQSESFDGYSYSKSSGYSSGTDASASPSWQSAFASRLSRWRKL